MGDNATNSGRSRILALLDPNSFIEFGSQVTAKNTDFNTQTKKCETDGVVTGYGIINGNPVYVYAQAGEIMGGTIGEMHSAKICELYDKAMLMGFPVIGLIDCGGVRLQEGIDALSSFAKIYHKQVAASGVIPQLTGLFGQVGGGAAILAGLSDVVYMEKNARLFINSPNALENNHIDKLNTADAKFQGEICGNVDGVFAEGELIEELKRLVSIMPLNNEDKNVTANTDDINRMIVASKDDVVEFIKDLADNYDVVELKPDFAKEIVTALIRLNGQTVGIVANKDDIVSANGLNKATHLIKLCDCYNIPVINLVNVVGFARTVEEEKVLTNAIAGYTAAYSMSTVAKLTVILNKAYGTAYSIFGSKALGADMVIGYDDSSVGVMDARIAASLMYENEAKEKIEAYATEYETSHQGALAAAKRGIIDTIIEPQLTRRYLVAAIDMLLTKREFSPVKKHLSF